MEPKEQLREKMGSLSTEELKKVIFTTRAAIARERDDPEGFEHFFWCVYGRELPEHAKGWIAGAYKAKEENKGRVIEAARGMAKTTIVTQGFTLFRIGHEPEKTYLLIQVGDDIAKDNTSQMANTIANNPGWKACFPHIEPDKDRGWGDGGYEVKRTDVPYPEWIRRNSSRKDPTLIGLGYSSKGIIGKRASGMLIVDDINEEGNTSSARMNEEVIRILTGTIFPTKAPDCWEIFIGTPWTNNDVLSYVKSIGDYVCTLTPIYQEDGTSACP